VDQFVFLFRAAAFLVGLEDQVIGIGGLRIFIEISHERVRGRAVQVVVILLDVLAVVTFTVM
jgi:hypothetical protein